MALTNLASMNDDVRRKIKREKGVSYLEDLMFENDLRLRRVATEALVNCFYNEDIFDMVSLVGLLIFLFVSLCFLCVCLSTFVLCFVCICYIFC